MSAGLLGDTVAETPHRERMEGLNQPVIVGDTVVGAAVSIPAKRVGLVPSFLLFVCLAVTMLLATCERRG